MKGSGFRQSLAVPGVILLLAVNLAVFILVEINRAYGSYPVLRYFGLSTYGMSHGWLWQLLTFQFLHFDGWHFVFNMFGLFIFGRAIEESVGKKDFLWLYLASGIVGGLLQVLLGMVFPARFGAPVVGASAGVFGLVAAYAMLNPDREILLFFVLPMRVRHFVWIAGGVSLFYVLVPPESSQTAIAHGAHLGGLLGGLAYVRLIIQSGWSLPSWRPILLRRRPVQPRPGTGGFKPWQEPTPPEPVDHPKGDFISQEVDPILDKISAHGMQSLTPRERKILEAARSKMERR